MAAPFTQLTAVAAPMLRDNIDTDAIIPSREIRSVSKTGLARGLFAGWRYTAIGSEAPAPDFILNDPRFASAAILLSGTNFGCGSSREHAVWALAEYGFRAILAPSFNPIFRGNCVRNGVVPVELTADAMAAIADWVMGDPVARQVTVDLVEQTVDADVRYRFAIDNEAREMLLHGLDPISLTLRTHQSLIAATREADRRARPWVYI